MLGNTKVRIRIFPCVILNQRIPDVKKFDLNNFRNNINDTIRYDFVEDSCGESIEINEFKSLVIENGLRMSKISIKSFQFKNFQNEKIFIHCQVRNKILTSIAYFYLRSVHVIQVLKIAIQFVKTQLESEERIFSKFRNFKSNHLDQFGIKIISISTNSNLRKNEHCIC